MEYYHKPTLNLLYIETIKVFSPNVGTTTTTKTGRDISKDPVDALHATFLANTSYNA